MSEKGSQPSRTDPPGWEMNSDQTGQGHDGPGNLWMGARPVGEVILTGRACTHSASDRSGSVYPTGRVAAPLHAHASPQHPVSPAKDRIYTIKH